jgi:L-amino acid N-acyltransferase YncA
MNATLSALDYHEQMISIRPLTAGDWDAVLAIYLEGIATGNATFQQTAPDWFEWNRSHLAACRIVARSGYEIVGWAALSSVSSRCVYAGVAEVSVYVAQSARGSGIGTQLLASLIAASEAEGIWTLQAGIFPENTASIRLHTKAGFRVVGTRERLGCMNRRWRDVILLERRSSVVGI